MTDAATALTSAAARQAEEAAARYSAQQAELMAKTAELEARTKALEELTAEHEVRRTARLYCPWERSHLCHVCIRCHFLACEVPLEVASAQYLPPCSVPLDLDLSCPPWTPPPLQSKLEELRSLTSKHDALVSELDALKVISGSTAGELAALRVEHNTLQGQHQQQVGGGK